MKPQLQHQHRNRALDRDDTGSRLRGIGIILWRNWYVLPVFLGVAVMAGGVVLTPQASAGDASLTMPAITQTHWTEYLSPEHKTVAAPVDVKAPAPVAVQPAPTVAPAVTPRPAPVRAPIVVRVPMPRPAPSAVPAPAATPVPAPTPDAYDEWVANPTFTCPAGRIPGWLGENGIPTSCIAN